MKEAINIIVFLVIFVGIVYFCIKIPVIGKIVLAFYGVFFLIVIMFFIKKYYDYRKSQKN